MSELRSELQLVAFTGELIEAMGGDWSPPVQVRLVPREDGLYEAEVRAVSRIAYVVVGDAGCYSEYHEWMVAAYQDEALARAHVEKASAAARLRLTFRSDVVRPTFDAWDERGASDANYRLEAVELRSTLPDAPLDQIEHGLARTGGSS